MANHRPGPRGLASQGESRRTAGPRRGQGRRHVHRQTYALDDGAAEGDYLVTVEWFKPVQKNDDYVIGPNLVPEKYGKPQTSPIEVHVAAAAEPVAPHYA